MIKRFIFNGIVQGIGFRPTVQRIANKLNITGQVSNLGGNVELIVSGKEEALDELIRRLEVLFEINNIKETEADKKTFDKFSIVHSKNDNETPFITPDLATCKECEEELFNPANRRYMHPFISCINCGPRYTVINKLPYDRENITMNIFPLCEECEKEYTSVYNKRCHAQTIACNGCGPTLSMSIEQAVNVLKSGNILAIKDIGGYHLACKTDCKETVKELRRIKGREKKPFAVMFSDIDEVEEYCHINKKERELLLSPARPIVLLNKKKNFYREICGDSQYIGAFLPCNPIQLMLLKAVSPLIMTSANISGEPIIIDDKEIKSFGVSVLSHNREILTPIDDSVVTVTANRVQFIRRARGYAPLAIDIGLNAKCDTLLLGGDLKAVFGYYRDNYVFLSQQLGDLENEKTFKAYLDCIKRFSHLHSFKNERIIADAHPLYYSSNAFKKSEKVQHHKAHCASVIAEHMINGEVLGFAFDGSGYGDDGAIWGSEAFIINGKDFKRVFHLEYTKMIGGDTLSKNADLALSCYMKDNEIINKAVDSGVNTVLSSSMGRLFDAMCALLNIKHENSFEGECAQALEAEAGKAESAYEFDYTLSSKNILNQAKNAINNGIDKKAVALGFHILISDMICRTAKAYKIKQIVLSGGVFLNKIITERTISALEADGFSVYINEKVPCGDGGIALGQAYISALED